MIKFIENNIRTNLKKIMIGFGTFLSTVITAVISYFMSKTLSLPDPELAVLIITILMGVEGLSSLLILSIFGKAKNGNGYNVPETKTIVELIKKDEEVREYMREKLLRYFNEESKILNNIKKDGE